MERSHTNIFRGAGTVLDVFPNRKKRKFSRGIYYKPAPSIADALKSDWNRVGKTLQIILEKEFSKSP